MSIVLRDRTRSNWSWRTAAWPTPAALLGSLRRTVTAAPWWRIDILEAIVGVALISLAGLLIPGHWGLLQLTPHPLLIVVLAIAIRYGVPSGYVAGGLAAVSYGLFLWLRPDGRFQVLTAHDLIQPFLLLMGGVIVSELVRAGHQRLATAEHNCQKATAATKELMDRYHTVCEVNAELENRIVGQTASVATLYEAARALGELHTEALYPAILDLVMKTLEAQACALYLWRDGRWQLLEGRPETSPGRLELLKSPAGVIGQAIRERQVVTVRDRLLQRGPVAVAHEPALMAGPLLDGDGQVSGVVVVERMAFRKLTLGAVQSLSLILDWASAALRNAELYERACDCLLPSQPLVRRIEHPQARCRPQSRVITGSKGWVAAPVAGVE